MLLVPIWNSRQIATNASPIGETNFFKLVNIFYWMKIPQAWHKNIMNYLYSPSINCTIYYNNFQMIKKFSTVYLSKFKRMTK